MITALKIERFKSIKHIELQCRRINVFIGEPNTGKSNILEALGFIAWCAGNGPLEKLVRFESVQNLFYDGLIDEPVRIEFKGEPAGMLSIEFANGRFTVHKYEHSISPLGIATLGYRGVETLGPQDAWKAVKIYRFEILRKFEPSELGVLLPPTGQNLFSVVYGSKRLREFAAQLFRPFGLVLVLKPHEHRFELQKQEHDVAISYPYFLASDTLQRTLFYCVAMESNKNSVLVFEEPEAHAFPYYTKHLGERIAFDKSNQYFIATHNPYLLTAIVEKANKDDVAVFGTRYRNYATEAHLLTESQLGRLLEADPFLGLESVLEGK